MKALWLVCLAALSGCAQVNTMQLAKDRVQITASAAPICGIVGPQNLAAQQAAIETLRRGYDSYIIEGADHQWEPHGGHIAHSQDVVVKMFHQNEPGSAEAISAREVLGPKWQQIINQDNPTTCT